MKKEFSTKCRSYLCVPFKVPIWNSTFKYNQCISWGPKLIYFTLILIKLVFLYVLNFTWKAKNASLEPFLGICDKFGITKKSKKYFSLVLNLLHKYYGWFWSQLWSIRSLQLFLFEFGWRICTPPWKLSQRTKKRPKKCFGHSECATKLIQWFLGVN